MTFGEPYSYSGRLTNKLPFVKLLPENWNKGIRWTLI